MHTPIEVNAVAGSKECRVKTRKRAFSHISMCYIDFYITKTTNGDNFIYIINIRIFHYIKIRYFINNLENMSKYRLIDNMNMLICCQ